MQNIDERLFSDTNEIYQWIKDLTQWGHRFTGTEEGRKSAEYIKEKFMQFGLNNVIIEEEPSICPKTDICKLDILGERIPSYFINGTNRTSKVGKSVTEAKNKQLVYLGKGYKQDFEKINVKGKIVLCDVNFLSGSDDTYLKWNEKDIYCYDPKSVMKLKRNKFDIYSPNNWPYNYFYALEADAIGFIGVLENYFDSCILYNEDYTECNPNIEKGYMDIPGMWISYSDGEKVKERLKKAVESGKKTYADMYMTTVYEEKSALNVSGILPGKSNEIILIHSHHDAIFNGAVQDGSGISEVLALAKYFSKFPVNTREKTLMFAATDSHYTDYQGHQGFIREREKYGHKIILDVVIEHIGKEVELDENRNPKLTGEVETRLFYVSNESDLSEITKRAIESYNLDHSIVYSVNKVEESDNQGYEFQQDEVISDAYYFHQKGISVVSMVCPEMYLFHPLDTIEMIPTEQLKPVGMAFASIVLEASKAL